VFKGRRFYQLIEDKRYREATDLLKDEIIKGEYVDPNNDYTWGVESDVLAFRILYDIGLKQFVDFHKDLLDLFQSLEKEWGHLHKGHLYGRIGVSQLAFDKSAAFSCLETAYREDFLLAKKMAGKDRFLSAEEIALTFPSYVALSILERLHQWKFDGVKQEDDFYTGLSYLRFDVVWDKKQVDATIVRNAISKLIKSESLPYALMAHREISTIINLEMGFSLMSGVSHFAETILCHNKTATLIGENLSKNATLQVWVDIFEKQKLFPELEIYSIFKLISILDRLINIPVNPMDKYPIVESTGYLISYCLKVLLDMGINKWADHIE
jgi:hypothetical protein